MLVQYEIDRVDSADMGDGQAATLILKILNGPHTGSQVAILPGDELAIGSGEDCDIVLRDPHISGRHCVLSCSDAGEVVAKPAEGTIYLEGRRVEGETAPLPAFQILTLGSTHLVCGPDGTAWPPLQWPEIKEAGVLNTPPPEEKMPETPPVAEVDVVKPARKRPKQSRGIFRIVALILLIIVGGIAIFVWGSGGPSSSAAQPARPSKGHLPLTENDIFKEYSRGVLSAEEEANYERISRSIRSVAPRATVDAADLRGNLSLTVYVDGMRDADSVQKLLNADRSFVVSGIIDRTSIAESLRILVEQLGYKLNVEISGNGIAYWTGFLPSKKSWDEIQQKIVADIPRQKKNVTNFVYGTELEKLVQARLEAANFQGSVKPEITKTGIRLVGQLSPDLEEDWAQAFSGIQNALPAAPLRNDVAYGGTPTAKPAVAVKAAAVHGEYFPSPVVFAMSGEHPWVRLANGDVLFPGAQLKGGYIFEGIEEGNAVVTGNQKKLLIPLERLD